MRSATDVGDVLTVVDVVIVHAVTTRPHAVDLTLRT